MPVPHHSVFTGQMPFLLPNQQRQSTEGIEHNNKTVHNKKIVQNTVTKETSAARLRLDFPV